MIIIHPDISPITLHVLVLLGPGVKEGLISLLWKHVGPREQRVNHNNYVTLCYLCFVLITMFHLSSIGKQKVYCHA